LRFGRSQVANSRHLAPAGTVALDEVTEEVVACERIRTTPLVDHPVDLAASIVQTNASSPRVEYTKNRSWSFRAGSARSGDRREIWRTIVVMTRGPRCGSATVSER
jgi:hypothetical protein